MRQDGMTQTQLATILDVGRASLGTVLDRLETGGLIRREVDSIDKRSNRVFLTKTAEKLIGKMIDQEKVFNELILKKVSPGDRDKAIEVLTSIKSALRDIVADETMV
jgi:DNA-binding MarR family transcriptional regulator